GLTRVSIADRTLRLLRCGKLDRADESLAMRRVVSIALPAPKRNGTEDAGCPCTSVAGDIRIAAGEAKHIAPFHVQRSETPFAFLRRGFQAQQSCCGISQTEPRFERTRTVVFHPH